MKLQKIALSIFISSALVGCGGGGGGGSSSDTPVADDSSGASLYTPVFSVGDYNVRFGNEIRQDEADTVVLAPNESFVRFDDSEMVAIYEGAELDATGGIQLNPPQYTGGSGCPVGECYYDLDRLKTIQNAIGDDVSNESWLSAESPDADNVRKTGGQLFRTNEGLPETYLQEVLGVTNIQNAQPSGMGVTVGVLEAGFDANHPFWEGRLTSSNWISVVDGYSNISVSNQDATTSDGRKYISHGNSVSSTIIGKHKTYQFNGLEYSYGYGSAPEANILALEDDLYYSYSTFIQDMTSNSVAESKLAPMSVLSLSCENLYSPSNAGSEITQLNDLVKNWKSGMGLNIVVASGNQFLEKNWRDCESDRQYFQSNNQELGCSSAINNNWATRPSVITVGSLDITNKKAFYSAGGSNLWVTAPGDQWLASISDVGGKLEKGTSFSTPFVSGVIANMIQANPTLTWREIRHILATTAKQVDTGYGEFVGTSEYGNIKMRNGWKTNAAGYAFSEFYGFGAVDMEAAINAAMTQSYNLGQYIETPPKSHTYYENSVEGEVLAPGLTPTVVNFEFDAGDGVETVENVFVSIRGDFYTSMGFMATIVSPSGTEYIVTNPIQSEARSEIKLAHNIVANGFYGESATGTWQLKMWDLTGPSYTHDFSNDGTHDVKYREIEMRLYGSDTSF